MTASTHTRSGVPALSVDGGGAIVAATVLGRGPVAVVYAGRLAATGAEVAVKVFPDRFDRDTAARFERERRALAAAAVVPSILAVESVGEYSGDRSSVITQLCAGSLAGMLTSGALPVSEVLAVGAAVAGALAAAHEAGVVHGGVTPHNVLFRRSGEPVLGDFGLALRERFSRDPMHALEFTAPETLRDDTRTTASDLYGLGAVLYAMLTGAPPFPRRTGQAPGERILRVLRDPVPPIQAIPGELSELVSLLLAKDPAARPADAARVAAWFDHVRGRGTAVPPALNPLAPPAAHPDTDFDSFAGRPETGPPQHFPPPVAAPPVVAALPLAPLQPITQSAIIQPSPTEPTHPRPASPPAGQAAITPPAPTQPPSGRGPIAQPSIHAAISQAPPPQPADTQAPPSPPQAANAPAAFAQPPDQGPAAFAQPSPPAATPPASSNTAGAFAQPPAAGQPPTHPPAATPPTGDHPTGAPPSIHTAISQSPPPQPAAADAPAAFAQPPSPAPIAQPSPPAATPPASSHTMDAPPSIHTAISQGPPPQPADAPAASAQPPGPAPAAFAQPPAAAQPSTGQLPGVRATSASPAPQPGRTLVYSVSGQQAVQKPRGGRWKIAAGIGVLLVAAGVAAVVVTGGGGDPAAQQDPPTTTAAAPESTAVPDIGLEVTAVEDLGDRVELAWSAEGDLDFSVVVAGERIDTMVLVANRQREMTVPVDPGRKYCFQIRATDSREIYTSEPVPIRGARCAI